MTKIEMLDYMADVFIYGNFTAGALILADAGSRIRGAMAHWRLRAGSRTARGEAVLDRQIRLLLEAAAPSFIKPAFFKYLTGSVFLVLFLMGAGRIGILSAAATAAAIAAMPCIMLRIRLESLRRRGSHEGEALVANILAQYRICRLNMLEALEQVIEKNQELKPIRRLLFKLLIKLRIAGSGEAVRSALAAFSFGIDTNWSRMLGNCVYTALTKGSDVSRSLEDILVQLREARALAEERKRLNSESVRMTIIMVPVMYASTVLMSITYLDLPASRFLQNQLCTAEGFKLFLMILTLFFVNLMLIEIVRNQRFDY